MKSVNLPYYYINVTIQSRRRQSYFCANSPKLLEFARQPHIFILRRKESKWKRKKSMNDDAELKNPLHIGTIESLCTAKLPSVLGKFREFHPKVSLQVTIDTPEQLIRMMEHNGLDLIYILDTPRWDQNWVKVMEKAEPVVFVASADSEFAGKTLKMEDILEEPFFLTEKNANYRQALDQQLALKKQALSPVLEISDTAFIIRMLEKNHGLSFLPYLAVERDIRKGRIALLHVEDVEISMYRQIFYHKNKFKTREMEEFIRLAAE